MASKSSRRRRRYSTQVQAESVLRFSPERSTLKSQLRQAGGQRRSSIAAARGAAASEKQTAQAVRPMFQRSFSDAKSSVDEVLSKLGVTSPDNAIARDSAGTQRRLAERLQMALDESSSRMLDADAGLAFSIDQANSQYAQTAGTVRDRLRAIAREQGAFQQARSGELSEADRQRSFTAGQNAKDRASREGIARADRQSRERISAGKDGGKGGKTPAGVKLLSTKDHQRLKNDEVSAETSVRGVLGGVLEDLGVRSLDGLSPGQKKRARALAAQRARQGVPSVTVSRPGEDGTRTSSKAGGVKAVESDLALKLALDMVFDKHVSRGYRQMLWQNGYALRILGLPGPQGTGGGGSSKKGRPGPKRTAQGQANDRASVASVGPEQSAAHVTVRTHTRRRPTRKKA